MRTTIDIPEDLMNELMSVSETRKKNEAVRAALEEFVRRRKIQRLLSLPGTIDISDVSAELEDLERDEYPSSD
ncbi:MAG: type II toxin-antitoxin system VapB family antitoxin [Chloroflexi bacterium]|nr:type II toxin-antitoxin system VapB family antitoxin [Chloroflexota bacterium]